MPPSHFPSSSHSEDHWRAQLCSPDIAQRQAATNAIIESYLEEMIDLARRYVQDSDTAEDIAQDICMRFWKQHQTVVVQTTYRVYLLGCTRNAAISARQNQRKEERRTTYNLDDYGTTENTAIFQLEASDIADCIERAITRMPTVRNEVVRVVIENDSTHREAAEILGIAERTVIDHMHQANKDIKRALIRADLLTSEQAERISKGRWAPWLAQLRNTSMPVLQELPDA